MAGSERRREPREAKRVMLTFTVVGEKRVIRAIATNISRSGLYIATGTLLPKGTRILVTAVDDKEQKATEFEVRNVQRFGDAPGMGLRIVVGGKVADQTGAFAVGPGGAVGAVPPGVPVAAPSTGVVMGEPPTSEPSAVHDAPPPVPAKVQASTAPIPAEPPTEEPTSSEKGTVFTMKFDAPPKYAETYTRDFKRGGAFIQASMLPKQDEVVLLEIIPPGSPRGVIVEARVVFRSEPAPGRNGGFGVEFVDRETALRTLPVPR